jgi:hypothetical protein
MATLTPEQIRLLPKAIGASTDATRGGDRPEKITTDTGDPVRSVAPRVTPPASPAPVSTVAEIVADSETPGTLVVQAPVPVDVAAAHAATDDDIDALHARFDAMEALLKRRLAVGTLNARFDNLEKWLNDRF